MGLSTDETNVKSIVTAENSNVTSSTQRVIRVATLYRVSTKNQLNPSENGGDIPTQRQACRDFINSKAGWVLVEECEYYEKGVSGFKTRAKDRDVIQQAKEDALQGKFDVLLVFMFDRLGRIDDETPFVLEWFVKQGIEMWSVVDGQQKIEGQMDKLMNYLRFWSANTESVNTSHRVNEKHRQMVEEGVFRGGTVPFGYKTVPSGEFNKKGKELLKIVVVPETAEVVKLMYDLVDQEGYGQYRIPQLLNEKGIRTSTGKPWASNTVSFVLRNPIYKGYMSYGRGTDKEVMSKDQISELVIIDEAKWERVQKVRKLRNPENTKNNEANKVIMNTKGSLILVGKINCGCCGNTLTTTWNNKKYKLKDGFEVVKRYPKYRCSGKGLQKVACSGQTTYAQNKLEGAVLDEVYVYLNQLETFDLTSKIQEMTKKNSDSEVKALKKFKQDLNAEQVILSKYRAEVIKVLNGESKFSDETLNEAIENSKMKMIEIQQNIDRAEREVQSKKVEQAEIEALQQYVPVWREVFEQASYAKQKMMLSTIINRVTVNRDRIEIDFKLRISQFIGVMGMDMMTDKYMQVDTSRVLTHRSSAL